MHFVFYVHILRCLALFISLLSFTCHLAQCLLLKEYERKTDIPDWMTGGHWQYLSWYISLGLSLAGSLIVICLNSKFTTNKVNSHNYKIGDGKRQNKYYSVDKCIGSVSLLPVLSSVITATIFDSGVSEEPWTNGYYKPKQQERTGLLTSCYIQFDSAQDPFYPLLYQRCMLSDSTWICAILLCIIWLGLVSFVIYGTRNTLQSSTIKTKEDVLNRPAVAFQEPAWGRYIPDPPSSLYSSTTQLGNQRLLVPTSILTHEKHIEFYAAASREFYYNKEKDKRMSYEDRRHSIPVLSLPTIDLYGQTASLFDDFHSSTKGAMAKYNTYDKKPYENISSSSVDDYGIQQKKTAHFRKSITSFGLSSSYYNSDKEVKSEDNRNTTPPLLLLERNKRNEEEESSTAKTHSSSSSVSDLLENNESETSSTVTTGTPLYNKFSKK
ncbi:MAG: hypothetical protein EXX96DRAFT_563167 [Benjaminiella poitrasii]|nr:MAG: hypothetical protein EXX96DRAFT_563167 [Benjaminiella poitrasii]